MANSIFGNQSTAPAPMAGNNPMQMLQQFQQFRQRIGNQNPQQMVQQLMQSGQMTQDQLNGLMQQAQSIMPMLRR